MVMLMRHCQTKGTETDRFNLWLLRQSSTLLKEVNGLCGKGIIPQVSEIKGLSKQDKEILNKKTENALKKFYDGAGNLPDEDFDGTKLKSSKTGSGTPGTTLTGDKVSDLKSSDPSISGLKSGGEPISESDKSHAPDLPPKKWTRLEEFKMIIKISLVKNSDSDHLFNI